jgi:arylsulfatase A-like enzyme
MSPITWPTSTRSARPNAKNGNYPLGWAQAADTPFKYWKSDANSEGGTHNPLIVYWPKGIKDKGGIRTQYSHVIDLLPTTLDLVGIKAPEEIRGIKQQPIEGTFLLAYSIDDAKRPPASHAAVLLHLWLAVDLRQRMEGRTGVSQRRRDQTRAHQSAT